MERIEIVIVPVFDAFVALPAVLVRQVLPHAPLMAHEAEFGWVSGSLIIRNMKLDVVDLSYLVGDDGRHEKEDDEKLIWFSSLNRDHNVEGFILRASGLPHFISCRADDIVETEAGDQKLIARYIQIRGFGNPDNLPVFILDLMYLEKKIAE